jgi:hypothetical protein
MSPAMVATIIDYHRLLPWIHHGVCIGYKWPEVEVDKQHLHMRHEVYIDYDVKFGCSVYSLADIVTTVITQSRICRSSQSSRPTAFTRYSRLAALLLWKTSINTPHQDDTAEQELFAKSALHSHEVEYLQLDLWPAGLAAPKSWATIPEALRNRVNGIMLLKLRMTEEDIELFPNLRV